MQLLEKLRSLKLERYLEQQVKANLIINVKANLDNLLAEIKKADTLVEKDYTLVSFSSYKKALEEAKVIAQNSDNQAMIDAAAEALKAAREHLVKIADVTALTKSISIAETLKAQSYTSDSFQNLTAALAIAKDALTKDYESQPKIDLSNGLLLEAFDNLAKVVKADRNLHLSMDMNKSDVTKIADDGMYKYDIKADGVKATDWVDGMNGNALSFGNNTSFEIPAGKTLATGSITISYWIKRTATLTGNNNILWAKKASSYNGNGFYTNYPVEEKYSSFFIMDGFNGFYVNENPNDFLAQNEWTNVVITWDNDVKRGTIYKNGVKQPISYIGDPNSITGVEDAANIIGENGYPGSGYPVGLVMDELSIYNDKLSKDEIKALYNEFTYAIPANPGNMGQDKPLTDGVLKETKETGKDSKTGKDITVITMKGDDKETQSKITATITQNAEKKIDSIKATLAVTPVVDSKNNHKLLIETKHDFVDSLEKLATKETPLKLKVVMDNDAMLKVLKDKKDTKPIALEYQLPANVFDSENVDVSWIKMSKEVLQTLSNSNRVLTVSIIDSNGEKQYQWNFNGKKMVDGDRLQKLTSVNLAVKIVPTKGKDEKDVLTKVTSGYRVTVKQKGEIPSGMTLLVPVTDNSNFKPGAKVYVYKYNEKKNEITRFSKTVYTCKRDGRVELKTKVGADYLILPAKALFVK